MKHIPLRCIPAALLAAALLAGCGAETAPPASTAAPASVSAAASTPEDRPAQKKPGADGRRTEQTVAEPPAAAAGLGAAGAGRVDGSHGGDAG
ncbi:hypothetical protein HMPREF9436_00599 [Faecalibacterium cf. prausnitzii KLE1255]|uniref:Lipoprotein n=1 Tax=Faecalibacterium cf. prausnitzii KLE1255 TaxID=748224 RepID=E2ZG16_9FIRM|nr:hypothetical protein [Faecalibacterium prausnitzii]EFQ07891.1 hypothetical protein HMPREF9436_00599 [Faecalibacterium cf. prausnitzii KLE1255]